MPADTCPNCHQLRAPNGRYCSNCGLAFDGSRGGESAAERQIEVKVSVGTGFRFGLGFALAISVFVIAWTILSALIFGSILSAVLH